MLEGGFFEHCVNFQSQRSVNNLRNHDTEQSKPGEKKKEKTTEKIQVASTESTINIISFRRRNVCDRLIG